VDKELTIFKSLFRGREDIYAIRWEKVNKSGYMPAYTFDPYHFKAHRMKGGTFQNYANKQYQELTDEQLMKHLKGEQLIGLYPLLKDNTSYFLAVDFDKGDWMKECRIFMDISVNKGIPAYLERSRSGNGGHVWIFFEGNYSAYKSRTIFKSLLENGGLFSVFDKSSSFDRLFPNQDFLSGKGFGNLIALPLFKKTLDIGNSCFINPETFEPFSDQWEFLKSVQRISTVTLDGLYNIVTKSEVNQEIRNTADRLTFRLGNNLRISRKGLASPLINYLKEELNFASSEFIIKKKTKGNTFGINSYFKLIEEKENGVIVPKGFVGKLMRFCKEHKIDYEFIDERTKHKEIHFEFSSTLREHQQSTLEAIRKKDLGIIVAPPGSGKTIIGLKVIADKKQPALIITHRKQIAEQWIERIQAFMGIPKHEINVVGKGMIKEGNKITIAMIQTLAKELEKPDSELKNAFGIVIIDECHHIPAETYRNAISKLNTFYSYGLTATPFRKFNDGKLIFLHLGEIITEIKNEEIKDYKNARIIIRNTELDVPYNPKTDQFETLSKILIHDSARNKLIIADIVLELKVGKKVVIITERKEHIDSLYQYLKQAYEVISLSGGDSEIARTSKWKLLKAGNYQALITTGQFFGEGSDLQNVNCLFLVYPFSFEGKLIQYMGRVQRSELTPTIYDYRDIKIDYLNKMFLKRNVYYRKIDKQATLFDDPIETAVISNKNFVFHQKAKIPFEQLEFRYGSIIFKYPISEMNQELEFDIENMEIRAEFEVLKPYFSKTLQLKSIEADIHAEFENGTLISQLATSTDIQRINRKIIEGVKFRFVTKNLLAKSIIGSSEGLLDINQLQSQAGSQQLYTSGEELLKNILKNKDFKHYKHLQYLAERHASSILKIRFVLSPFSFVFLISGERQYHIIMETLDTEEATYIWHFENSRQYLPGNLEQIDKQLNIIRNKGRQAFLENPPDNFSRIFHDYSDSTKGFVIWKGLLEEGLI
jgi:superfamily II DNA or RNA helicase